MYVNHSKLLQYQIYFKFAEKQTNFEQNADNQLLIATGTL